jgi:hypothetical protein
MTSKRILLYLAVASAWLLSACAGADNPRLLATFPRATPIAIYPGQTQIIYNAYIEINVSNVDLATERAAQKAYDYGGYMESSQSWYVEGRKHTTLALIVPAANFDLLHDALLRLGNLVSETVSGERAAPRYPEPQYSHITLQLSPAGFAWPQVNVPGWRPLQTLQKAFNVFLSIFGFLADILIWVIVVGGPFALLGWLVWRLLRRLHPDSSAQTK